jgi:serine/threonine-protein kinase
MPPQAAPAAIPSRVRAPVVTFGPFEFDPNRRFLTRNGLEVALPPRVLAVLELLLGRAGDVVSRQEIIESVWKDAFVTDTSLAEAVSFLRQALGDDPQTPTYVQTVHRRGYRFVARLTERPETAIPAFTEPPPVPVRIDVVKPSIVNELVPWSIAIVAGVLAISAVWYSTNVEPVTPPVIRLAIDAGTGLRFDTRAPAVALSPGGGMVAWSGCRDTLCQLYLRPLDQLAGRAIVETDGASAPFFSPDERWLGFFADGKLKKVAIAGGSPQIIADASQPYGAAWMRDGRIVFAASAAGGLMTVSENGGAAEPLTSPAADLGEIRHAFPASVRDGDALLFTVVTSTLDKASGRLALLPYPSSRGPWRTVAEAADVGVPVGHEYVAFASGSEIHGVAFDRVRQAPAGADRTVATGVLSPHIASAQGAFVFVARPEGVSVAAAPWSWNGPGEAPISSALEQLRDPMVSPDGSRIAGVGLDPRPDVWSVDVQRGTKTRLTYGGPTASPIWRQDGAEVLFAARKASVWEIWSRPASASGDERRVIAVPGRHVFPSSTARSGDIAFVRIGGPSRSDVGLLRAGQNVPSMVVATPFDEVAPALSPDGALLAYQTDESGRWEIVLLRLRDGRRSPISTGGGIRPFWSADGRTVYFERGAELVRVSVGSDGEPTGGMTPSLRLNGAVPAGITAGGRMLLHRRDELHSSTAVVTLQWINELRAKLGPPTAASPR